MKDCMLKTRKSHLRNSHGNRSKNWVSVKECAFFKNRIRMKKGNITTSSLANIAYMRRMRWQLLDWSEDVILKPKDLGASLVDKIDWFCFRVKASHSFLGILTTPIPDWNTKFYCIKSKQASPVVKITTIFFSNSHDFMSAAGDCFPIKNIPVKTTSNIYNLLIFPISWLVLRLNHASQ